MKVEWTINVGQFAQIVAMASTVIGATFWLSGQFHGLDLRLSLMEAQLQAMNDLEPRLNKLETDLLTHTH